MSKKLMVVWGFTVVIIFTFILWIGVKNKDMVYYKLEKNLKEVTEKYISDKKMEPKFNSSVVVFTSDLIKEEYISDDNISKYCVEKIIFTKGLIFDDYEIIKKCNK